MEKRFEDLSAAELAQGVKDYFGQSQPAPPQHPDAPGCAGLSPAARQAAAELYGASIMKKQAGQLSAEESDFLEKSIRATLREMGQ